MASDRVLTTIETLRRCDIFHPTNRHTTPPSGDPERSREIPQKAAYFYFASHMPHHRSIERHIWVKAAQGVINGFQELL